MSNQREEGQKNKEQVSFGEDSNLLDSDSKANYDEKFLDSDDSSDGDFKKIEIVQKKKNKQKSQNERLLQSQVLELQMKVNALAIANQRLVDKINENREQKKEEGGKKEKEEGENVTSTTDISEIQGELSEVEEYLFSFKSEFLNYQKKVNQQLLNHEKQVDEMEREIQRLLFDKQNLQKNLKQQKQNNYTLSRKNEELLMDLEDERERKTFSEPVQRVDYSYGSEMQYELERIIERLADELKHERNMKKKFHSQIKELTKELNESQKTIQKKNEVIYNLELKLLKGEKKNFSNDRTIPVNRLL